MPTVPTDQHLYDNYRSFPGLGPEETYPGEGRNPLGYYSKASRKNRAPHRESEPPVQEPHGQPTTKEKPPTPKAPRDRYNRISEVTL